MSKTISMASARTRAVPSSALSAGHVPAGFVGVVGLGANDRGYRPATVRTAKQAGPPRGVPR